MATLVFITLISAIVLFCGAKTGRMDGGGFISGSPKLLKAFLWSLIPAIASGTAMYMADFRWWSLAAANWNATGTITLYEEPV